MVVGQVVNMIWMPFNAVLPLVIASVKSSEQPLEITVDLQAPSHALPSQEAAHELGEATCCP